MSETWLVAEERAAYGAPQACYYCGMPADTIDHVVPQSMLADLATLDDGAVTRTLARPGRRLTVPACRDCNSVLGSLYFDTLAERKAHVKQRLRSRLKGDLLMPDWTDAEIEALDDRLREHVLNGLEKRRIARARLAW